MKTETFSLGQASVLYLGEGNSRVYLYLPGQCGNKEEAADFAKRAGVRGYDVLALDLPGNAPRPEDSTLFPGTAVDAIQSLYAYAAARYASVRLRANSLGAWLGMHALQSCKIERALFVSPVIDMESLILNLMQSAGISEEQLRAQNTVTLAGCAPLSREYLSWVRRHVVLWTVPTEVLYGGKDALIRRTEIDNFTDAPYRHLTVFPAGEHWFHTQGQLAALTAWEKQYI